MSETNPKKPEKKFELTDDQLEQVAGGTDVQPGDQPEDQIVIIDNYPIHHMVTDTVPSR